MRYMCAERNKLRRVFSTAIDLVKAETTALIYSPKLADVICERSLTDRNWLLDSLSAGYPVAK